MGEWINMPLGTEVGLGPGHIVLDGDPAPPKGAQPHFRPMSVAAKRSPISTTAEHLFFVIFPAFLKHETTNSIRNLGN